MEIEDQHITDKDYEFALRALEDLSFRQSEEFANWLGEADHYALFKEISTSREALMNLHPEMVPNVDKAWKRIDPHQRQVSMKKSKRYYLWATGAAAAIILFVAGYTVFSDKTSKGLPVTEEALAVVYPLSDKIQEVELKTDNGQTLIIDKQKQSEEGLIQAGAKLEAEALVYQEKATEKEIKVTMHTLSTPRGKDFKLILEDGTEVWLNAESRLHYPNHFNHTERRVELEGEAFFHVAKDPTRPFIVKSGTAETRVLGTEFNFRSYPHEDRHVTLVSGSILVSDSKKENELQLKPGENVPIDENEQLLIPQKVDINEFIAWKDDLFCFRGEKLIDIMKAIGRWYNLEIAFTDEAAMHYHFNFWARRTASPQEVLRFLNQVGKVKAVLKDTRIIVSKL